MTKGHTLNQIKAAPRKSPTKENLTEGHTLNNQILRDIFYGFGSFSL